MAELTQKNSINGYEKTSEGNEMVSISMPQQAQAKGKSQYSKRCIKKVPDLVRREEQNRGFYDPVGVSIGPYHHGKADLKFVEDFKPKVLELFIAGSGKEAEFFYSRVLEAIHRVRSCYVEKSTDEYDDAAFARMMLHDACFIIIYIQYEMTETLVDHLGKLVYWRVFRDFLLLENQIPFWFLRHLTYLRYGKDEGEAMLKAHLTLSVFDTYKHVHRTSGESNKESPQQEEKDGEEEEEEEEEEPLHLLDATRRILIGDSNKVDKSKPGFISERRRSQYATIYEACQRHCFSKFQWIFKEEETYRSYRKAIQSFRSVTNLKAKGIHFRPSPTDYLTDLSFSSSYFYGKLQLPTFIVNDNSKTFFLNMVAFEMCLDRNTIVYVTNYIYFMKSLIQSAHDVKELREQKIIFSELGSDEEVLQMYKDIDTYGVEDFSIAHKFKKKIQDHYDSKAKTWVAELIYTYFRSPWSAIALLATIVLLFATLVQTYFAVHPASDGNEKCLYSQCVRCN